MYPRRSEMAIRTCHLGQRGFILESPGSSWRTLTERTMTRQTMTRQTMTRQTMTRRTRGVLGGRSDRVVQQVLVATVAELAESGYRAFRMDAVSAAAGVNKTTIYRRWASKALLVAGAVEWMRRFVHDVPLPDTGSLEQDLVAAFRRR